MKKSMSFSTVIAVFGLLALSPMTSAFADPAAAPRSNIAAVWANDGNDKVMQHERRAAVNARSVQNSHWTGTEVKLFGAKNEVVSFNLIVEAEAARAAKNVSVAFSRLDGPGGSSIVTQPASDKEGLFDWTKRPIELFFVRYLKIEGVSSLFYDNYDERHVPKSMRLPYDPVTFKATGVWKDRPAADRFMPEIAVPLELQPKFGIAKAENQSIWTDIYIPRFAVPGLYKGTIRISEDGIVTKQIPVRLTVRKFRLPEEPSSKTMLYMGYQDINERYVGRAAPSEGSRAAITSRKVMNRHFMLAHRHKLSLIDNNLSPESWNYNRPRAYWVPILDGTLFSPQNGYDGPGVYTGNGVFSIGTYSTWSWRREESEAAMHKNTDAWESWFQTYAPGVERFLYLVDESTNYHQTENWASWLKTNPGVGKNLASFATIGFPEAFNHVPSLDIATATMFVGDTVKWETALQGLKADGKKAYMYNGKRPSSGSFATEDDGTAMRMLPWAQHKKGIDRWFFWETTYYNDFQGGGGATNVFQQAQTIGTYARRDPVAGKTGYLYSNGDGVLFYPGTDRVYPEESYDLAGPIASLRIKFWRRGVQDIDYVKMAERIDPVRTKQIVEALVPKVLWEPGVTDPNDPTWVRSDIGWATGAEEWETARAKLADIIESRI